MASKQENTYSISTPREFFSDGEGQRDAIERARGAHLTPEPAIVDSLLKLYSLVSVTMSDQATALSASPNFAIVPQSSTFARPEFESHLFFTTHWIFKATAGGTAPTQSLTIELQTWLNQYHILISPSGFANDWTVTIPPIAGNATFEFSQTFQGAIFNLELRKKPQAHIIDFLARVQTIPTGWSQITVKPRFTMVHAIPTTQTSFVKV